jgi:hypothetical protein
MIIFRTASSKVPPHPVLLPEGRREAVARFSFKSYMRSAQLRTLSPWGEGWGEGVLQYA